MNLQTLYSAHVDDLSAVIASLRRRNRGFVTGEIVTFLLFVGFLVLYTVVDWGWPLLALSALSMVLYAVIRNADVKNGARIESRERLRTAYEQEVKALDGDFTAFGSGQQYVDAHHPFSYDLDIFGPDSLFQRMNRTVTSGGSDRLAHLLMADRPHGSLAKLAAYRQAVGELVEENRLDWRMRFIAMGVERQVDSALIRKAVGEVSRKKVSAALASPLLLGVVILLIAGFVASVGLAVAGRVSGLLPLWWAMLQFFVALFLCHRPLHDIYSAVDQLHGQLSPYVKSIQLFTETDYRAPYLTAMSNLLGEAEPSFLRMERLLKSIERRSNELWMFLSNAMGLHDFFLVRQFLEWQRTYVDRMGQWIDAVSDADALVSMATFGYNHPEACEPEVVESQSVVYEARRICHPFLGAEAVKNDFDILDRNYYIITGANMAGKSTFLRTIGVNYVMAMAGLPVFADSMRVSMFHLFTSMRTADDLTHGISYFNAELLRLQQLIGSLAPASPVQDGTQEAPSLIILDEILKGTNSLDKLNGSRLFLEYISHRHVSGVIATHDLELSKMADEHPDRFHNYCFEIELGTDVTYSYLITPGVARNQNATFLLKKIIG
jgi:hypothetical protein